MTSTPPRAVVVGTGFGCLTHVPALRDAGFEVAALVGRDPERTRSRAERFDVPLALTSYEEALALDADVVAVVTPPHTHCDLVVAACEAGKHVVCEKPFAASADEAQRMLDAAEAAGVHHLLGCEFRFGTGQALLRRVVQRGDIGEPRTLLFVMELPLIADHSAEVPAWWEQAGEGGGWFGAHGSHWIDQVQSMLGPIVHVSAALPVASGRPGMTAEDTYTIHLRTASGVSGVLHSSAASRGPMLVDQRVTGTLGTAWVAGDAVHVATAEGTVEVPVPDDLAPEAPVPPPMDLMVTAYDWMHSMGIDRHPYARLYGVLRSRLAGEDVPDDPPPATFADGVLGMRVMDAVRRSAREGMGVSISN